MLDSRKEDMITYYLKGDNITDIAKKIKVSRQAIYDWLKEDEVKAELDSRRQDILRQGNNIIMSDLEEYILKLKELARQTDDKRTSFSATTYLLERVMGKISIKNDNNEELEDENNNNTLDLEDEFSKFKKIKQAK